MDKNQINLCLAVGQAGLEPAYTDYSFMSGYKPAEIQPPMYQKNPPLKADF